LLAGLSQELVGKYQGIELVLFSSIPLEPIRHTNLPVEIETDICPSVKHKIIGQSRIQAFSISDILDFLCKR
jgi:hypothetical protein